jgi:hypothetical protein
MKNMESQSLDCRVLWMLSTAWEICIQRIAGNRIVINKESSLQLHYAYILSQVGELACINKDESFMIELETNHFGKNIDIWCSLGNCEAAIELKCFRKVQNRAKDTDMYDVLKDIKRLESYSHVSFRRFICLTDDEYYTKLSHRGYAGSVSIGNGKKYYKNVSITPAWVGKWKNSARDNNIVLKKDVVFTWKSIGCWYYLFMEV